ncbi:MAG: porphobilinogen synthase [Candidatus Omnitrophica bacterium]|nr:porphobilinogen synthase [Candidatus Omnitrophota bacterium]
MRGLVSQTQLLPKDLIMPYFVIEGKNKREEIKSMPGVFRLSVDDLIEEIKEIKDSGIKAILLFGIPKRKDDLGSEAYSENGIVQRVIKVIKKNIKDIVIISDVCLCGYTSHGHCGIVTPQKRKISAKTQNYIVDNDETLKILSKIALSHARAGADFVAPSAMMDGQVKVIRETLDKNGLKETGILAYSAKYASNFYGPFREALNSAPQFGDRKSYQMDFRNSDEALREIEQDLKEGADIVMVKPALCYLDIIYRAKHKFKVPIAAYNVSGEYSLVEIGAREGIADRRQLILEILTGIKRAGADLIITYHAKEVAKWL